MKGEYLEKFSIANNYKYKLTEKKKKQIKDIN